MAHMWLLWLKNRWRGASAAAVAVVTMIVVTMIALSRSAPSISFLHHPSRVCDGTPTHDRLARLGYLVAADRCS